VCIFFLKVFLRLEITSFILDILWPLCLPVTHRMQIETLHLLCMGGPGTNYCMQCQQYFCGICKAQHNRQRVSRNHEFQSDLLYTFLYFYM
jgi:hypothetical protein